MKLTQIQILNNENRKGEGISDIYSRWVCPQCFTSARKSIATYKEKPEGKCPDHFTLDWVEILFDLVQYRNRKKPAYVKS